MTYFQGDQTNVTPTTETPTNQSNQDDYVAKVVAEKGDQWSNPQVLAKSKIEADSHITNLENQLKEMREDMGKQDYAKTLIEQLQGQKQVTPPSEEVLTGNTTPKENTTLGEDELKNLIKSVLGNVNDEDRKTSNLRKVDEKLSTLFGTDAQVQMEKRSTELGLSKERMAELAGESPDAFFRLIGEAPKVDTNKTNTSSINTSSFTSNDGKRDWNYYQNLRRENKSLYYKPAIQKQLLADKLAMGSNFGN